MSILSALLAKWGNLVSGNTYWIYNWIVVNNNWEIVISWWLV
jgi:hypothetical protein